MNRFFPIFSATITKIILVTCLLTLLTLPAVAKAEVHFIRAGAGVSGNNTGIDWNNAWDDLPAKFVRGDTYYVADGSYGGHTFDTADSGTTWIYIKKATSSDHGTDTGWSSAYGDGTAVFTNTLQFESSYWELDGQWGSGKTTSYGFAVRLSGASSLWKNIKTVATHISDVTLKHFELQSTGTNASGNDIIYFAIYGVKNFTLSYAYLHGCSRTPIYITKSDNFLIEYVYIDDYNINKPQHTEAIASRLCYVGTVRYSVFEDIKSTGGIIIGHATDWNIYGNIFFWTSDFGTTANNGAIGSWSSTYDPQYHVSGVKIYNNTFVDLNNGGASKIFPIVNSASNNEAYNNVWYNSQSNNGTIFGGSVAHNFNWFYGSGNQSEPDAEYGTGDPFIDYKGRDFRLAFPTQSGSNLGFPYNQDSLGFFRGSDGTWDRGAFEYLDGIGINYPPSSPTNLQIL